jgi:hypothetical protein
MNAVIGAQAPVPKSGRVQACYVEFENEWDPAPNVCKFASPEKVGKHDRIACIVLLAIVRLHTNMAGRATI